MIRYARTYGSRLYPHNIDEAWQFPTGPELDTFGVEIPEEMKTFGLEEFNFNKKLIDLKLAYVPCYGTERTYPRPFVDELHLMYLDSRNPRGCYMHYATLYNVQPILDIEIAPIRLNLDNDFENIYLRNEVATYFGEDFQNFVKIISEMRDSDLVASNQNNRSFLVNVRYEELVILDKPMGCQNNSQMASQWKTNMIYPNDINQK